MTFPVTDEEPAVVMYGSNINELIDGNRWAYKWARIRSGDKEWHVFRGYPPGIVSDIQLQP